MMILTLDELKQKLIKNELNYNSCSTTTARQFHFNYGYILIHHFFKNYDAATNKDFICYLDASKLYTKVLPLIISNTSNKSINRSDNGISVNDAVCLRLQQIDNLVCEIKTLLNTN